LGVLLHKGVEHETRFVESLRDKHPDMVEIDRDDPDGIASTVAAMRRGVSVVVQAHLELADWHGFPDFLFRVDGTSTLGDYHYEPWDTKLARSAKPYFLVQLCAYAEMLAGVQQTMPQRLCFVLGHGEERTFRTADFIHYHHRLKQRFEQFQREWRADDRPDPAADRSWGRWSAAAEAILAQSDHLSRVANIRRRQMQHLEVAGIATFTSLATTDRQSCPPLSAAVFHTLQRQASLQARAVEGEAPPWELRDADPQEQRCGLALLPPGSPEDVFFDLEGFPFAQNGLEYLWGASTPAAAPEFHDWWAHDPDGERRAFEQFIDWVTERRRRDSAMHIYHYASYEKSALCRLASYYGTREFEVDDLLRRDLLVDLFTIVRQGVLVGTHSYSLKYIEKLFRGVRESDVISAAGSVVEYQRWLDSGEPDDWRESPILASIRDYNRVDCESTLQLRDWLLDRQRDAGIGYLPAGSSGPSNPDREPPPVELLAQNLTNLARHDSDLERQRVIALLAYLVEWHRREDKPYWQRYSEWLGMTAEELHADPDCLAGLERTDRPAERVKLSRALEYLFDPTQETRVREGSKVELISREDASKIRCEVLYVDFDSGLITLKQGPKATLPDRMHVLPYDRIDNRGLRAAVERFAAGYAHGTDTAGAVDDLLFRRPPRITDNAAGPLVVEGADVRSATIDLVSRLDSSTICIQGPPGSGKTTTAAAAIAELVRRGKRVGVTANGHKVIVNLLCAAHHAMAQAGVNGAVYKVGGDGDPPADKIRCIDNNEGEQVSRQAGTVIGGTAWFFSRDGMVDALDYLFVDEAGQVSLANAIAVGQSATNLVLIGDPMQLSQPTKGAHPGESGQSALEYMLQGRATIPPALGIFLATSYRMHPDVCRLISEAYYDGRLTSDTPTAANSVVVPSGTLPAHGIAFVPLESDDCSQCSDEEADAIVRLVHDLLGGRVTIKHDAERPMTHDDILIVAPFNAQVRLLRQRLGDRIRIGSVDKFQGQEAPVVIVSMCASTLDDAPRGAEFLLSPNRLNVAISRAQALAIVVGSSKLADARCRSVEEMQLVSGWCRVGEFAGGAVERAGRSHVMPSERSETGYR
jgi:uncharacterized protein